MSNCIDELVVLSDSGSDKVLFSEDGIKYVIPLYQRAYSWKKDEITQLIEDIYDFPSENNYYIGSLIVSKTEKNGVNEYEVIDGQQRLTTLFLILSTLCEDIKSSETLTYTCRKKSDDTLQYINALDVLKDEQIEKNISSGKDVIDNIIINSKFGGRVSDKGLFVFDKDHFISQLKKVKMYRIEVPENTDLNRYFEIMNTRGEQLEQHDIIKARLMGYLKEDNHKDMFATIWDACSKMTGYIQMNFDSTRREELFASWWGKLPKIPLSTWKAAAEINEQKKTVKEIIESDFTVEVPDGENEKKQRVRFKSIITFPYFLLHTLKVLVEDKHIQIKPGVKIRDDKLVDDLLDDKKLSDAFSRVIKNGYYDGNEIEKSEETLNLFSLDFIQCLLKCRFLFDCYIIKREYVNENSEGEWSLKSLKKPPGNDLTKKEAKRTARYVNTRFKAGEHGHNNDRRNRVNLMLQASLRVSYTSAKTMHWITELLIWLYKDDHRVLNKNLVDYKSAIENIAISAVEAGYIDKIVNNVHNMGTQTPNIVFNYLDFLLWEKSNESFEFEFRNSVEHWYPQKPEGFPEWCREKGLDNFGNLSILQRNLNSRFSNLSPHAKQNTYVDIIAKESLKLRIMAEIVKKVGDDEWREHAYLSHESEMLEILRKGCDRKKQP